MTKEKLFKQVLPNGKFSLRRMNNLLSEAYQAIEKFIIFQNLANDHVLQKDILSKEFQQRHLEDSFFKTINQEIQRLEEKSIKDWEDHLALLQFHRRIYHHPNANPRMQAGGKTIIKMGEETDLIFLLEKALIINEKIARSRILKNENYDIEKELKEWREAAKDINHPALYFYKMRFDYNDKDQLNQYFKLRTQFLDRYQELSIKQQKTHFINLLNDTILFVKKGILDITEMLPLYKLGLQTKFLFNKGKLIVNMYVAILSSSNTKKDFDFSHKFIENYTSKLEDEFQKDALNWARAHTAYWQGNISESLDILIIHDFQNIRFLFIAKLLTTQTYFDLYLNDDSYQMYLFNYFDSFEKWLSRQKSRSKSRLNPKSYLRFVQLSRTLAKWYSAADFNPEKVKNLLKNEKNIQAFNWLNNKKEEVVKSRKK